MNHRNYLIFLSIIVLILSLFLIIQTKTSNQDILIDSFVTPSPTTQLKPTNQILLQPTEKMLGSIPTNLAPLYSSIPLLFSSISKNTGIKFSQIKPSTSSWLISNENNKFTEYINIPSLKITNNYVNDQILDKLETFFIDSKFTHDGFNDGDGTVVGSRGYISNNIFCILEIGSIPNEDYKTGGNPFSGYSKISLNCGYTDQILNAPTQTPYN